MNKIKKIWVFVIASIAIVALAIPIALAQSSKTNNEGQKESKEWRGGGGKMRGKHHGHGFGMHGFMSKKLNLTDAQKAQMKQIAESSRERTKPLREELQAKRKELRALSEGVNFNEALATQKLIEMSGVQAKLMGEQFRIKQEMLSVLTPEQKTQMEQMRAEEKAKNEQRKAKRAERKASPKVNPSE